MRDIQTGSPIGAAGLESKVRASRGSRRAISLGLSIRYQVGAEAIRAGGNASGQHIALVSFAVQAAHAASSTRSRTRWGEKHATGTPANATADQRAQETMVIVSILF
jgi:hypothetical protein